MQYVQELLSLVSVVVGEHRSRDYHMTTHLVYTHQWCRSKRPSEVKVGPWVVGGTNLTCSAEGVVQRKDNEDGSEL